MPDHWEENTGKRSIVTEKSSSLSRTPVLLFLDAGNGVVEHFKRQHTLYFLDLGIVKLNRAEKKEIFVCTELVVL